VVETEENVTAEKQTGGEENVDAEKENPVNESEEKEPEEKVAFLFIMLVFQSMKLLVLVFVRVS